MRHKGKVGWGGWEIRRFRAGSGTGSELPKRNTQFSKNPGGDSLPAPSPAFSARDCAGDRAHPDRTSAWQTSGWLTCDAGHHCRDWVWAPGGARGSKGSLALQHSLPR